MANFCNHCGNKVPDGLDRCPYCGKKIKWPTEKGGKHEIGDNISGGGKKILLFAGIAVVAVAALAGIGMFVEHKPGPGPQPTMETLAIEPETAVDSGVDHSAEVQVLQDQYNQFLSDYQSGLVEVDMRDNGASYYQDGELRSEDANADETSVYNREYYYKDGDLYIMILRDPSTGQENDVYVQNGQILRWRDVSGTNHDDFSADSDAMDTLNTYLQEGYDLYAAHQDRASAALETMAPATPTETATLAPTEAPTTVPPTTVTADGFIFPDSDSRYLSESELAGLSDWELRVARNELYARHGRKFKDTELQNYFNGCSWYNGTINPDDFNDETMFNKYEMANRDLIRGYEKSRSGSDNGVNYSVVNASGANDITRYTAMGNYRQVTSGDGTFSFAVPTDLFNVEVSSDTQYSYYYRDSSDQLQYALFVGRLDDAGDALSRADARYREYRNYFSSTYFDSAPTEINDSGSARGLIGGYYDSSRTRGAYVIVRNDGRSTYYLEFDYYTSDPDNEHSAERYMEDYLYRSCSFSGTSYLPRNFELFRTNDMGSKK